MRPSFINLFFFFLITSCSNINFLLDSEINFDFLKNKTSVYVDGWNGPALKEILFLSFGEAIDARFVLTAEAAEKQTKRSVSENQVAQKIDYKITINYRLSDRSNKCSDVINSQTSRFSFTPKSSGYNFASDVLLQRLYKDSLSINVNNFVSYAHNKLKSYNCLDEN